MYLKKIEKNNKGFTLVELIITVVILALVTAPFLSSFISASKTNVESKRIQEANELSQYVIEQFKASSVEKLISTYKLAEDTSYKIDGNEYTSSKYTGSVSSGAADGTLPTGFSKNYSAVLELTPAKSVVNSDNAIPVIDSLDKSSCAVFAQNISMFDSLYGVSAVTREVLVSIDYDTIKSIYKVTLTLTHKKIDGSILGTESIPWEYATTPSVYILYKPLGIDDKITIKNNLSDVILTNPSTGEKDQVNVYIINQKDKTTNTYYNSVSSDNIIFTERPDGITDKTYKLTDLVDNNKPAATLGNTVLYTNMKTGADKNDTINGPIKMKKIETIYNLNVKIMYDGKEISTFNSTKTLSD